MKYLLTIIAFLSVIFGILNNKMQQVSMAAISEASKAIELALTLTGGMCLWSGLMEIAQRSGLTTYIAKIFSPLICLIFKDIKKGSTAVKLIAMNMTANLLGLGNAATPLGINAMQELQKENPLKNTASDSMVLLTVINTASIQLVPTTVAILRLKHGSQTPFDVIPCVIICSLAAITVAVGLAKILNCIFPAKGVNL